MRGGGYKAAGTGAAGAARRQTGSAYVRWRMYDLDYSAPETRENGRRQQGVWPARRAAPNGRNSAKTTEFSETVNGSRFFLGRMWGLDGTKRGTRTEIARVPC